MEHLAYVTCRKDILANMYWVLIHMWSHVFFSSVKHNKEYEHAIVFDKQMNQAFPKAFHILNEINWRLDSTKSLSEPMLEYCWWDF